MTGDIEREALIRILVEVERGKMTEVEWAVASLTPANGIRADAILAEFLPAHDKRVREGYVERSDVYDEEQLRAYVKSHMGALVKRVRAEQRETDAQIVEGLGSRLDQMSLSYDDAAWLSGLEDAAAAIRKASDD